MYSETEKYTAFVVCGLEGALKLKNNFPKHHVILIDAGFINDYNNPHYNEMRRTNYSVAFMEEDGTRTYVHQTAPPDRWQEKNYQSLVNDWTSGDYVLLTMQSHWDANFRRHKTNYNDLADQITALGFDLRIRPHPLFKRAVVSGHDMIDINKENIFDSVKNALATVTVTSSSSVIVCLQGHP